MGLFSCFKLFYIVSVILLTFCATTSASKYKNFGIEKFEEVFAWKRFTFKDQGLGGQNGSFFEIPMGLAKHEQKLFLGFPRRSKNSPMGLGYVDLSSATNKSPEVIPYPSKSYSDLSSPSGGKIVSVFRPRVDSCNRLWFMDTGLRFNNGVQSVIQEPSLIIIDLDTDAVIKNHTIKNGRDILFNDPRGLVSITIDVIDEDCQNTFAYIPDLNHFGMIVYSLADDDSWRVRHNYFGLDPEQGDFNMNGLRFQWSDGVFSVALGPVNYGSNYREAAFHSFCSTKERVVSTSTLRNKTLATRRYHGDDFWVVGDRGPNTNSNSHAVDIISGVLFSSQGATNSISCWNIYNEPLNEESLRIIVKDDKRLVYPSDLSIDQNREMWIISNKYPYFSFSTLDPNEINFRIHKVAVDDVLVGSGCQTHRSGRVGTKCAMKNKRHYLQNVN